MQTTIYTADEEMALMSRLWAKDIANNPEAFVRFVFPWGKKGTPLEHHAGPRRWQRDVLRQIKEHIDANNGQVDFRVMRMAVASGRGIGKSALVSWLVIWMLSTRIGGSVIVSANSEAQLRSITWSEITKWLAMSMNSHWFEISATRVTPAKWMSELVERDLRKGTRYWSIEGRLWSEENPDAYAGLHNSDGVMLIFDESSGIPDKIWDVAQGFFTENTPEGYFYECFNAKRNFWTTQSIDARQVEDTDKAVYEQIIEEYGADSPQARIEVYGQFPADGDDQFIPPSLVDEAASRPKYKDETAPIVLGVDPARSGNDSTVIVARQGRDIVAIKRYKGEDTMEIVGRAVQGAWRQLWLEVVKACDVAEQACRDVG